MTVATNEGGGTVAAYDADVASVGLEDVEASDLRVPRLNIDHDNALFYNSLTKESWPALTVVTLGLVKQRILWPKKLDDDAKPLCKSPNNKYGFPNMNPNDPKSKQFPWSLSNFDPSQAQPTELPADDLYPQGWSSNGHGVLPCDHCTFAKWGKDEDGKNTPPPCNEQHTYPILYMQVLADEQGNEETVWVPAIFTVQRSAISNSRSYINGFAQAKQAFFTQYTGLTLRQASRGTNEYCIPEFRKMGPSDRANWPEYANQYRSIREYLRAAPRPKEDDAPDSVDNSNTAPVTVVAEPPSAPAQEQQPPAQQAAQAAPPAPPAPPAAPAAAPPQPQAAPAPAAPTAAPPAPPAPASPPAPPAPPAAATPPAPPAPASPPQAAPGGSDELPF